MTTHVTLQDLRRVSDALAGLRRREIADLVMRSDFRQLRVELEGGLMLVVAAELDDAGRPHLEVDVVRSADEPARHQLEVGFDPAP